MLKLDEKKIRKGKPIGLPYQGSKKKISKKIVEIIKQNFGTDKPIYDIFGGGGAITAECILNGLEVHYNDLDKDITDAFERVISQNREWIKTLIISRDEFFKIKQKEKKMTDDFLKLLVNSFGNNKRSFIYSKEISNLKYNLGKDIIKRHDTFSRYKQTEKYKQVTSENNLDVLNVKIERNKVLRELQQLQQLQQIERLQQITIPNKVKPTNKHYQELSKISGAILYLDPPYENTDYDSYKGSFNSQEFYNWAFKMSERNIVIISSYSISDDRFEEVYSFDKSRGTFVGGTSNKCEKLFMVKS